MAAASLGVALLVSGCSRATSGLVGLQRLDNSIVAVVRMCDGHFIDRVTIVGKDDSTDVDWTLDAPMSSAW